MRLHLCTWILTAILPTLAPCQSTRRLTGTVLLPDGKPAQGAIVKLESQSGEIRTAIATAGGTFQFSSLLTDTDYQVRARFGALESNRVHWTRWSSRKEKDIKLKLRPARTSAQFSYSDQVIIANGLSPTLTVIIRELDLDTQRRCTVNRFRNYAEVTAPGRTVLDVRSFSTKVA